jgi:hypothetical protein
VPRSSKVTLSSCQCCSSSAAVSARRQRCDGSNREASRVRVANSSASAKPADDAEWGLPSTTVRSKRPRLKLRRRGLAAFVPGQSRSIPRYYPSHRGQSLQSMIPIMISEPIATTTGQINGNSSNTPTTTARTRRALFIYAKRQPATPIGHLRLAPSSGRRLFNAKRSPAIANSGVSQDQGEGTVASGARPLTQARSLRAAASPSPTASRACPTCPVKDAQSGQPRLRWARAQQ